MAATNKQSCQDCDLLAVNSELLPHSAVVKCITVSLLINVLSLISLQSATIIEAAVVL